MASNENERVPGRQGNDGPSAEQVIESVRDDLAAIDALVFHDAGAASLDEHLAEIRGAVARLLEAAHG